MAKKDKVVGAGLVGTGTYLQKLSDTMKFKDLNRPMYGKFYNPDAKFMKKPFGGYKVRGRAAMNNKMRWAEFDAAVKGNNAQLNKLVKAGKTIGKVGKGVNLVALGLMASESIHKGYKRATGPGGTEFHTKKSNNKYGTKGY